MHFFPDKFVPLDSSTLYSGSQHLLAVLDTVQEAGYVRGAQIEIEVQVERANAIEIGAGLEVEALVEV